MGSIRYDGITTHFNDELLTHMHIVIVQKLMREESFLMSWKAGQSSGDGRTSIWLSPQIPLTFTFMEHVMPDVNKEWLERLGESANSTTGLVVTEEDGSLAIAEAPNTTHYPGDM